MSLYANFKSPGKSLVDGVWIDYGEARVKIRYAGKENTKFTNTFRALTKPYSRIIGNEDAHIDKATEAKIEAVLAEIYAKSVIADWEGVVDEAGNELPCTWENAKKVLMDLPLFFAEVKKVAGTMQAFRKDELEDESKNSSPS